MISRLLPCHRGSVLGHSCALAALLLLTCSCGWFLNNVPAPEVSLDSDIYTVKAGCELKLSPSYANLSGTPEFVWLCNGELLSNDPELTFVCSKAGEYYVTIVVTTSGGSAECEVRIDVTPLDEPKISLAGSDDGFTVIENHTITFIPTVTTSLETTFQWSVDSQLSGTGKNLTFFAAERGEHVLRFSATNQDGTSSLAFKVFVCSEEDAPFDWEFESPSISIPRGRTHTLAPLSAKVLPTDADYCWYLDTVQVQKGMEPLYIFQATAEGNHDVTLRVSSGNLVVERTIAVQVCPVEGTYQRAVTASSSVSFDKVYEYLPAPGQFINENFTASTMDEACRWAESRLAQGAYVSLGGFGGYIVVGFDHSIVNDGGYNIAVTGNAYKGNSEPGVVWVMQDSNGNGLPDDIWYELAGSEFTNDSTDRRHAVTYHRPAGAGEPVSWSDNRGATGQVDYMGAFHKQDSYYPAWVGASSYTLYGTCLPSRNRDTSGNGTMWVNGDYEWGYADNFSAVDRLTDDGNVSAGASANHFKISDAVTYDGRNANLMHVDFVKIQTAVNAKSGWLGELSSEVLGVSDYNMVK